MADESLPAGPPAPASETPANNSLKKLWALAPVAIFLVGLAIKLADKEKASVGTKSNPAAILAAFPHEDPQVIRKLVDKHHEEIFAVCYHEGNGRTPASFDAPRYEMQMIMAVRLDLMEERGDLSKKLFDLRAGKLSPSEFASEMMGEDYRQHSQEDDAKDLGADAAATSIAPETVPPAKAPSIESNP